MAQGIGAAHQAPEVVVREGRRLRLGVHQAGQVRHRIVREAREATNGIDDGLGAVVGVVGVAPDPAALVRHARQPPRSVIGQAGRLPVSANELRGATTNVADDLHRRAVRQGPLLQEARAVVLECRRLAPSVRRRPDLPLGIDVELVGGSCGRGHPGQTLACVGVGRRRPVGKPDARRPLRSPGDRRRPPSRPRDLGRTSEGVVPCIRRRAAGRVLLSRPIRPGVGVGRRMAVRVRVGPQPPVVVVGEDLRATLVAAAEATSRDPGDVPPGVALRDLEDGHAALRVGDDRSALLEGILVPLHFAVQRAPRGLGAVVAVALEDHTLQIGYGLQLVVLIVRIQVASAIGIARLP